MSFRKMAIVLFTAPLFFGCVSTDAPIGETPVSVHEEDWEGIWVSPDETYIIEVLDEAEGRFLVSELKEGTPPKLDPMEMHLSKVGNWYFGNWTEDSDEFIWFRVHRDGDHIIVWLPDPEGFEALVDEGVLPGEVRTRGSDGEVFIGPLTDDHLEIITGEAAKDLFVWNEPFPLYRVQGPERGGGREFPSDRYRLDAEDLAPYDTLNAYEAVRRLRRFWLQGAAESLPRVFANHREAGEPSVLEVYPVGQVLELRFIPQKYSVDWFGSDYAGGVILVKTKQDGGRPG
jgi:hypothetical protein